MATCSVCGKEVQEDTAYKCYDCGRIYCKECAKECLTMEKLGVCSDCGEIMEGEENLGE